MTNIWADIYKDIREPFFEIEDPYVMSEEKKEKKEKEEKEPKNEKEEKKEDEDKPKRWWDDDGDGVGYEKGEVSGSFKKKAKSVKEGVRDLDPEQGTKERKERLEKKRGMKLDDHPQYKKEEVEIEEGMKQARKNVGASKCWDGYKAQGTKKKGGKEVPNCVPEERELHSKSDSNEKIDVRRGIKNKIDINPREELEAWIQELLSEGYDLSQFTLEEIADIYESAEVLDEVNSSTMPARGDAETVKPDPLQAAKRRAAQAQVRKELSDLQVAKARATAKLTPASEAVINFVGTRRDLFEARFDPKKSKLRPASERTKSAMTDAQRKAAKKEAERTAEIHSKGETVLAGLRQGKRGKVQTTPAAKPAAPEANRTVRGRQDKLAAAADKVLKGLKK